MPVGPGGNDRGMATPAYVLPQLCLTLMGLSPLFWLVFFKLQWAGQRGTTKHYILAVECL